MSCGQGNTTVLHLASLTIKISAIAKDQWARLRGCTTAVPELHCLPPSLDLEELHQQQ